MRLLGLDERERSLTGGEPAAAGSYASRTGRRLDASRRRGSRPCLEVESTGQNSTQSSDWGSPDGAGAVCHPFARAPPARPPRGRRRARRAAAPTTRRATPGRRRRSSRRLPPRSRRCTTSKRAARRRVDAFKARLADLQGLPGRREQVGVVVRAVPAGVPVLPAAVGATRQDGRLHRRQHERQRRRRAQLPRGVPGAPTRATRTRRTKIGEILKADRVPDDRFLRLEGRARLLEAGRHTRQRGGPASADISRYARVLVEVRPARDRGEVDQALALRERVFCGEQGVTLAADQRRARRPRAPHRRGRARAS